MNAMSLFEKAMEMLGYASAEGISGREDMLKKALTLINNVYAELHYAFQQKAGDEDSFVPIVNINDSLNLPTAVLNDIAPYGVAMYLAQSEGDADNQSLYANIYNQKKVRGKRIGRIKDRLPHTWG